MWCPMWEDTKGCFQYMLEGLEGETLCRLLCSGKISKERFLFLKSVES